jgi:4-aminobutyrate aminotransferase / (S)-3-amino-2-methylpropionate transaminase / 5-aminovalerate transaminase
MIKMKTPISDIKHFSIPIDETVFYDQSVMIEKAKGSYLYAEGDPEPYFDLVMGYSSTNFGHINDKILNFVQEAITKYDNITSFNSESKIELSRKLVNLLPFPNNKTVYYPVGGTKAIDAAIKLAKAYTKCDTVITFKGDFHGYSYGGMLTTDNGFIEKEQYGSLPGTVITFPFPDRKDATGKQDANNILGTIDNFLTENQSKIACILFEPIQGAAGFIIPPDNFLIELVALAKKYHVITICDEIQTGMGRTGTFYYINQLNINPNIILMGKSLAGGFYPLSAVIADKALFEAVNPDRPGFDSTFANSLLGIEIANKVIDYIQNENILNLVNQTGSLFMSKLKNILKNFEFIKELDGIGMAYSFRVEAASRKAEDNTKLARFIRKEAFKNHLILQTAGVKVDYVKIAPNFFITENEISLVIKKLQEVMIRVNNQEVNISDSY